eukprot:jgi/Mesvir1/24608/Mv21925-RA.1
MVPPLDRSRLRSNRRLQRALRARARLRCQERATRGLNWLWGRTRERSGGPAVQQQAITASPCTVAQRAALQGMEDAARVYNRRLTAVAEATDTGDAEPAPYGPGGQYEIIDPERMALPKGGAAGSVKLLDCLPEAWQRTYEDINNILQRCDAEAGAWMRRGRVSHGCASDAAYARLSIRLAETRMIEYSEEAPPVVNGCFAVPKKDPGVVEPSERRQRFIGNMVPCNRRFLKPPTCYLPNLGEVAELSVGAPCYSGKTDLDTYYYRFEVPESCWRPYFSLPPVWSDEVGQLGRRRKLYPRFRVLVMGWSHSVVLAQVAHLHCLYGAGVLDAKRGLSYPMHLMGVRTVRGDGMDRLELVESAARHTASQPDGFDGAGRLVHYVMVT